jgi:hypothetical protein
MVLVDVSNLCGHGCEVDEGLESWTFSLRSLGRFAIDKKVR